MSGTTLQTVFIVEHFSNWIIHFIFFCYKRLFATELEEEETLGATGTAETFESSAIFNDAQKENEWNWNADFDYFNDDQEDGDNCLNYLLESLGLSRDNNG